jgi:Rhodopirellula transposase DDE domain
VGGKTRTGSDGKPAQAWDHDPPAKEKWVPFGFLVLTTGTLMLIFGLAETSDSWVDALQLWWEQARERFSHIKRLVIYLDNGPNNSGRRTQFLKRMVQFADWSGLEIRLVYYPPYHSKYNPVERCWSALERKWNGLLLNCVSFVLQCARRMTWKGQSPEVLELAGRDYPNGIKLTRKEMKPWEARLDRSTELPKYDITIKPLKLVSAVN